MPFQLDNYDISILRALLRNGRKSFREISRETGITTPTVKARFNRLVNVGFIKAVSPILNFDIVEEGNIGKSEFEIKKNNNKNNNQGAKAIKKEEDEERIKENRNGQPKYRNQNQRQQQQLQSAKFKIKKGMKIKLDCEFCKGPIIGNPHLFRFANYERFFCCTECRSAYKTKYAGRIEAIKRRFEGTE
jgi:DNA-binding Lrp family transcriptional regulator